MLRIVLVSEGSVVPFISSKQFHLIEIRGDALPDRTRYSRSSVEMHFELHRRISKSSIIG